MRIAFAIAAIALAATGCSKLTPENYAKIGIGMTYGEVTQLIGDPASCDDTAGFKTCRWGDAQRNVTVRFVGEKVILHTAVNIR